MNIGTTNRSSGQQMPNRSQGNSKLPVVLAIVAAVVVISMKNDFRKAARSFIEDVHGASAVFRAEHYRSECNKHWGEALASTLLTGRYVEHSSCAKHSEIQSSPEFRHMQKRVKESKFWNGILWGFLKAQM